MDKARYLDLFISEGQEHLQALGQGLPALKESPKDLELLKEMHRRAHSLKGIAATMGFENIADLASQMEDSLRELYQGEVEMTPQMADMLFDHLHTLESLFEDIIKERKSS
jgi:two-component system chemotaxis sensor kinase CheA